MLNRKLSGVRNPLGNPRLNASPSQFDNSDPLQSKCFISKSVNDANFPRRNILSDYVAFVAQPSDQIRSADGDCNYNPDQKNPECGEKVA